MNRKQVFNIVRAFQEAGVCGAALCLATAASECLSCGLIDSPAVLGCLRSISLALDGSSPSALPGGERGELTGRLPAQDAYIGAAGLVATCERRKVTLPPGFAESVFESLRRTAAHRRGAKSGIRVASLLALASVVGCPLLGPGEFAPRCGLCAVRFIFFIISFCVLVFLFCYALPCLAFLLFFLLFFLLGLLLGFAFCFVLFCSLLCFIFLLTLLCFDLTCYGMF